MKPDAPAEVESIGQSIFRNLMSFRQARMDIDRPVIPVQQILEDVAHHRIVVLADAPGDVHRGRLRDDHGHERAAPLCSPGGQGVRPSAFADAGKDFGQAG